MEMLAAFVLFIDKGIKAVEKMYPEHVSFVRRNMKKTKAEVKKELLHTQAA